MVRRGLRRTQLSFMDLIISMETSLLKITFHCITNCTKIPVLDCVQSFHCLCQLQILSLHNHCPIGTGNKEFSIVHKTIRKSKHSFDFKDVKRNCTWWTEVGQAFQAAMGAGHWYTEQQFLTLEKLKEILLPTEPIDY